VVPLITVPAKMNSMLHEDRARAESFGAVAERYDRARPSYPPALIDALLASGPRTVLDVGCGTGIASILLKQRGCAVLGVEVDARMAEVARSKGIEVEVDRFEDWQPHGRRFDLVLSGQAWHWVDPHAGALRAAQALHEGGEICLFWNFGTPPAEIGELLQPIYARVSPEMARYAVLLGNRDDRARAAIEGITSSEAFDTPSRADFAWSRRYTTSSWLDQLATHSDHRSLPPERLRELLEAVGAAIDSIGGSFEMPYETLLVKATRVHV